MSQFGTKITPGGVAVVTGAASGIGRGIAERFLREGLRVALADVDGPRLAETAQQLAAIGPGIHTAELDVSDRAAMHAFARGVFDRFGRVDVLCNNAGVLAQGRAWEVTSETWEWILRIDLLGVVNGVAEFVPFMLEQRSGYIVNTSSMSGLVTGPGIAPYVTAKHAVVAFSECLFKDLALECPEIGVSILCPGFVPTNLRFSGRRHSGVSLESNEVEEEAMAHEARSVRRPDEIANEVWQAMAERRLWVLTHPERASAVLERAEEIVDGRNPRPEYPT
jgi:NAD(P)-dependent dehydrogenase (short-subunit alcohol dehydrogenase family)